MRLSRADVPVVYALTPNQKTLELDRTVASLIRGGARWIQIREKHLSDRDFVSRVSEIIKSFPSTVSIFANDRIDLAIGVGAAGVHLGDRDLPPELLSRFDSADDLIVGVSTHSFDDAIQMSRVDRVDYVALGPIFESGTKMVRDALGLTAIERVRERTTKPIVAIGGIDRSTIGDVIRAGADGAAVIGALYQGSSIEDNVRELTDRAAEGRR